MRFRNVSVTGLIFATLLLPGCQPPSQGGTKFSVTGQVLVNGQPAEGVQVRLISTDESAAGQDRNPTGVTDELGNFQLSSFGGNDGGVAGSYQAVFFWPTNILKGDKDRLRQRFADASQSKFAVTIEPGPTQLPTFDLTLPADQILPSELSAADVRTMSPEELARIQNQ